MLSHLKVKVFTMSAEMTYIRRQEEKWKNRARYARQKQAGLETPSVSSRDPIAYAEANFWSQHWHRAGLKTEARITHLAYGAMKGVPYSQMEIVCYGPLKGFGGEEPNWVKISATVERFSKDEPDSQAIMQKFAEWLADAKLWYEGNPERIIALNNDRLAERAAKAAVQNATAQAQA